MKRKAERSSHDDPDVQLMLRFHDGEEGAFQQFFNKHAESVVNFVFRFLRNRARAEEIAQDVFLQVYRWQERYEPKVKFSTWLFKIANNHCLNEVRKREYRFSIDTLDHAYDGEDEAPIRPLPDQEGWLGYELLAVKETADRIKDILSLISDTQRTALLLSRLEGLSFQEVAGVLGYSEKAVKSLVFRATQSLRVGLKDVLRTSLVILDKKILLPTVMVNSPFGNVRRSMRISVHVLPVHKTAPSLNVLRQQWRVWSVTHHRRILLRPFGNVSNRKGDSNLKFWTNGPLGGGGDGSLSG